MAWREKSFNALNEENMFENAAHQTRFREMMDCFSSYPFFTRGVCKCVYLSAWDEEHFCILLETLTDLSLGKDTNTKEMSVKGDALAEELMDEEALMYQFSVALLNDTPFQVPDSSRLSQEKRYLIRRALKASEIIDAL